MLEFVSCPRRLRSRAPFVGVLQIFFASGSLACRGGSAGTVSSASVSTVVSVPAVLPTPLSVATQASALVASASAPAPALSLLYSGPCSAPKVFAIGTQPAFVFPQTVVMFGDAGARTLFRTQTTTIYTAGPLTSDFASAGGIDEAHAWAEQRSAAPGGSTAGMPLFAARGGKGGPKLSKGDYSYYSLNNFIAQPDGSLWAFGKHNEYGVEGEPELKTFAWSKDGELIQIGLPGADMSGGIRLATGEIVLAARGKGNKAVLRRWSPRAPVADLVLTDAPTSALAPSVQANAARVIIAVPAASKQALSFWQYAPNGISGAALNARQLKVDSWSLTASGDLYVVSTEGALYIEHLDGHIDEEKLPEPGALGPQANQALWIGATTAVYRRGASGWLKLTMPTSVNTTGTQVEWAQSIGEEVLVGFVEQPAAGATRNAVRARSVYTSRPVAKAEQCDRDKFGDGKILAK
jgi:hypothetical protein